jgi:tetratricopeptide (TPR) repeat protein
VRTTVLLAALAALAAGQPSTSDELVLRRNQEGADAYQRGAYEEAIRHFESAAAIDPRHSTVQANLARALHARGLELRKEGRLAAAADRLRRGWSLDPGELRHACDLARVLVESGLTVAARQVLDEARVRHPGAAELLEASGRLHYDEEFLEEAARDLEAALRKDPARAPRLEPLVAKIRREQEVESAFVRNVRGPFTVKCDDAGFARISEAVLDLLDRIHNELEREFRVHCGRRVTVILYSREDFAAATQAREWSGGLFDGKIRLPVRNFDRAAQEIEATLRHELAHLFVLTLTQRCPLWLNEGIAQHWEGRTTDPHSRARLRERLREGRLPLAQDLPGSWVGIADRAEVALLYAHALHLTQHLVRTHGWLAVRDLVGALADLPTFEAAAARVLGRPWAEIEAEWRQTIE